MKQILIIGLIMFLSLCGGTEKGKSHLKEMNLFGQVKDIKETSFNAILAQDTVADLRLINEQYYYFNEDGNIFKEIHIQDEDSPKINVIYVYNNKNLNSEQLFYGLNDELLLKNEFTYDNTGNILSQIGYDKNDKKVISVNFEYDKSGRLSKRINYNYLEKKQWSEIYSYDENSRLESKMFLPEQDNLKRIEFKYDSIGNPIFKNLLDVDDVSSKYYYQYSYDDMKNWIKCFEIIDDKVVGVRTRLISYY